MCFFSEQHLHRDIVCFNRHDLAELLIRLKEYDKAEKLLIQFIDQEQKGLIPLIFISSAAVI